MNPPKRFDIFPPCVGYSEGLDTFRVFFKQDGMMPKKKVFIPFSAPSRSDISIIDQSIAPPFLLVRIVQL